LDGLFETKPEDNVRLRGCSTLRPLGHIALGNLARAQRGQGGCRPTVTHACGWDTGGLHGRRGRGAVLSVADWTLGGYGMGTKEPDEEFKGVSGYIWEGRERGAQLRE
jgi:hypothetical protein